MSIRFACPVCKTSYTVDDADAGKKSDCKKCGQRLQVPVPPTSRSRTVLGEVMSPEAPALIPPRSSRSEQKPIDEEPAPIPLPSYLAVSPRRTRFRAAPIIGLGFVGVIMVSGGLTILLKRAKQNTPVETASSAKPEPAKKSPETPRKPVEEIEASVTQRKPVVEEEEETPPPAAPGPVALALSGEQVYQKLVSSSVFLITPTGAGTGFVVNIDKRLVITNYHVVGRENEVAILFPMYDSSGELITDAGAYRKQRREIAVKGEVIARDATKDLALIRVEKIDAKASAASLATKPAATGSTLFSVGGSGVGENLLWRLTKGTVRGRVQRRQQAEFGTIDCMILESDAPLNHGDSGGPVMNDRGELVAVVSHGSAQQRQVSGNIDVEEVKKFLKKHSGEK